MQESLVLECFALSLHILVASVEEKLYFQMVKQVSDRRTDRLGVSLRRDLHLMVYIKHQIVSPIIDNSSFTKLSKSTQM